MQNIKLKTIKIFILLSMLFFSKNVFALELPTFEVGNSLANIGEEIEIPIRIENNAGFSIIGMKIDFDVNSLTFIQGEMLGFEKFDMKDIGINDKNIITFYAVSLNEVYQNNQNLLLLKFKVNPGAVDSTIHLDVTDYATSDLENIEYQITQGTVSILDVNEQTDDNKVEEVVVGNKINYSLESNHKLESSDSNVATVNEDNSITFHGTGEVKIVETNENGEVIQVSNYKVVDKMSVTVYITLLLIFVFLFIVIIIIISIKNRIK